MSFSIPLMKIFSPKSGNHSSLHSGLHQCDIAALKVFISYNRTHGNNLIQDQDYKEGVPNPPTQMFKVFMKSDRYSNVLPLQMLREDIVHTSKTKYPIQPQFHRL